MAQAIISRKSRRRSANPDLYAILGRFSDALALLECVNRAMAAGQEDNPQVFGAEIHTLDRTVKELRGVYTEVDRAIATMRA